MTRRLSKLLWRSRLQVGSIPLLPNIRSIARVLVKGQDLVDHARNLLFQRFQPAPTIARRMVLATLERSSFGGVFRVQFVADAVVVFVVIMPQNLGFVVAF